MILPLVYYDDPLLRKRSEPVKEITGEIRKLVYDMIDTMDLNRRGSGISACQVGHLLRIFVLRDYIETTDGKWTQSEPKIFINPKLSKPGKELLIEREGCLSIPGVYAEVARPDRITVEALDINGNAFTEEIVGYNARIRMHENDHLNGVLFIDRLDFASRKKIDAELRAVKKKHTN